MICEELPILSTIVWLPLAGAILLAFFPTKGDQDSDQFGFLRTMALIVSLGCFIISLRLLTGFSQSETGYQFVESHQWIKAFGITYTIGIDGISIFLILLTTFLTPIIVLASHSIKTQLKGYLVSMLVLETAMLGTLVSLDLFLFYLFWELMLAPMYYIIGIWGGKRKIYAALKFVIYTAFGSVLMFAGIFYAAYRYFEQIKSTVNFAKPSFLLADLLNVNFTLTEQMILFAAFGLAFAIKVPLFPFHTWLPDAHVEAPTGGSVVLAGVLLKMGIYGFIRFAFPLFPDAAAWFAPLLAVLGVIGIVYGAMVAWVQTDMKKLVAYSSVSHLGYCMLGLCAVDITATSGSIYQMLNHGISTGALFLLVGVLYDRKHTRLIADYGGLASKLPIFAFLFLVFTLSSIALPLTNGFVGEFLILAGSFKRFPTLTTIALLGVILGAVYMLTLYMKIMYGEINEEKNGNLKDLSFIELLTLAPLFVFVFVMGIYPKPFLSIIEPSVAVWVENNKGKNILREEKTYSAKPILTSFTLKK